MKLLCALHHEVSRSHIFVSVLKTQEGAKSFYTEAEIKIIDVSDSPGRMKRLWLVADGGLIKDCLWGWMVYCLETMKR